eukprot:3115252-Rhodomonas_salina.3
MKFGVSDCRPSLNSKLNKTNVITNLACDSEIRAVVSTQKNKHNTSSCHGPDTLTRTRNPPSPATCSGPGARACTSTFKVPGPRGWLLSLRIPEVLRPVLCCAGSETTVPSSCLKLTSGEPKFDPADFPAQLERH